MKNKNKIWIYLLAIMGVLLMLTNMCKKDEVTKKVPVLTTFDVSDIKQTTATCGGNIASDGGSTITVRGVCWNIATTPTISDSKTINGAGTGIFLSAMADLRPNTTYNVRAYATNSGGTGYGNTMSFTTKKEIIYGSVNDIDGNTYKTVTIGTQFWMAENLKVTKYNNGATISYTWVYNDSESNVATYGRLYTWYEVADSRQLCPTGWHVPSDDEWTTLTDYLTNNGYGYRGSGSDIAKSMAATSGWTADSTAGNVGNNQASNNSSGFTALPGGKRALAVSFPSIGIGNLGYWWSSTEEGLNVASSREMDYIDSGVNTKYDSKYCGFSVRCIKN
jgi:uncharacterized protein (TIGR02145 family)